MRIKSLNILILFLLLIFSCNKPAVLDDETVAIVGKKIITMDEYKRRYSEFLEQSLLKDNLPLREKIAGNMINEILLTYYDDNSIIQENKQYQKELNWLKKQAVLSYLKDQEIYAKIEAPESEIRQAFARVNEKIAARHLYAPTEEEAVRLYNALQKGADFEILARQVFTDSILKNNGGYLGYFTWGDMDPAFEEAVYQMKIGEISHPVKTSQGYSIIKLEDRKPHPLLIETDFLKRKSQIRRILKIHKKKEYEDRFISQAFDTTRLKFNNDNLKILLKRIRNEKPSEREKYQDFDKSVCVEYNSRHLSLIELENKIKNIPDYHRQRIISFVNLKTVIKGILIQEALLALAEERGYDTEQSVVNAITGIENNLFLKTKLNSIVQNSAIQDSNIIRYYKEHPAEFQIPKEINIQEIIVDNHELALFVKGELLAGKDFAQLAIKYSLRKWSSQKGGVIGFAPLNRFGKIKRTLWKTEIGKVIGPLEIEGFYGVFKVLGKKEAYPDPLEDIKYEVIKAVRIAKENELIFEYLKNLKKKVSIHRNDQLIRSFVLNSESI